MAVKFSNNAKTLLSSGITSSATSISVSDASAWPTLYTGDYSLATLVDISDNTVFEIVKVTAISSNTLTVVRGQEGTTARAFNSGDKVELRLTAGLLEQALTGTDVVKLDSLTASATASYSLAVGGVAYSPANANALIVSLNGVTQEPNSAFTVSGSTITFASALTANDSIDYIVDMAKTLDIGEPSDNTVSPDKLTSAVNLDAITDNGATTTNAVTVGNLTSTGIDDNATSTAITISSSEYLGIGTTTPEVLTHLKSADNTIFQLESTDANVYMKMVDSNTTGAGYIGYETNDMTFWANNAERVRINSSGNVGIGTSSPNSKLHTTGSLTVNDKIYLQRSSSSLFLPIASYWNGSGSPLTGAKGDIVAIGNTGGDGLVFANSDTERMRIDSSGNVGIGTASPVESSGYNSLTINDTTSGYLALQSAGSTKMEAYVSGGTEATLRGTGVPLALTTTAAHDITFDTNAAERMRIDSSGRTLIGTTVADQDAKLTVVGSGAGGSSPATISGNTVATFRRTGGLSHSANVSILGGSTGFSVLNLGDRDDEDVGRVYYDHTNNAMLFDTNAAERMRIDSSGHVGIGTTSLSSYNALGSSKNFVVSSGGTTTMTIHSGTTNYGHLAFADGTAVGNDQYRGLIQYFHTDNSMRLYTNAAERMRIDASGQVGIGLTPSAWSTGKAVELGFQGNALWGNAADEVIVSQNAYYNSGWKYATTRAATHYSQYNAAHRWFTAPSGTANSAITWTQAMTLDSSGRLGIGTSSPAVTLDVFDTSAAGDNIVARLRYNSSTTANTGGRLQFTNQSGSELGYIKSNIESGTAVGLTFGTFSGSTTAERMRIDSSGNVGIGTASPARELVVYHASQPNIVLQNSTSGVGVTDGFQLNFDGNAYVWNYENSPMLFGTNNSERMRIDSSGRLLVGQTSGSFHIFNSNNPNNYAAGVTNASSTNPYGLNIYLATTNGAGNSFLVCSDNANRCFIRGDGDLENINNSYGAISDERVKSNIVNASSQIDDIMAVQVRSYTLNETGETHIGVVAQELEASGMSGLVQKDEEGMKSVKYSVLYMKAIKALQEAVTRIETLEAEVAALKRA